MSGLLTAKEIAERLRVQPETVREWTRNGIIPGVHINQRVIRYELDRVLAALRRRNREHSGSGVGS